MVLDAVDEAIHDIIGKESPIVEGLGLPEASGSDVFIPTSEPCEIETPTPRSTTFSSRKRLGNSEDDDLTSLKKKLLEVEIISHKIDIRKKQIELYKLEIEVGLPPSEFTKTIYIEKEKNLLETSSRILDLDDY